MSRLLIALAAVGAALVVLLLGMLLLPHEDKPEEVDLHPTGGLNSSMPLGQSELAGPRTLIGQVVDESGIPLAKVAVLAATPTEDFAWPLDAPSWNAEEHAQVKSATTDSKGEFRIPGLAAGPVQVALRASEREFRDFELVAGGKGPEVDLGQFTLPKGCRVRGRAISDSGQPARDATIFFLRPESTRPHAHAWTGSPLGRTDAQGQFELTQLEPGPFTLAIDVLGGPGLRFSACVYDELDLGEVVLPRSALITGIVQDFPIGELSDLIVVAIPTEAVPFAKRPNGSTGQAARWLNGYETTPISEHGNFAFTTLRPDTYYSLRALAPGDSLRVQDVWSPPKLVRSGTEDVVLMAHPSVRMDFEVVDAKTGDPIPQFERTWIGARSLPRDGVDYLRATTSERRVTLEIEAPGYALYRSEPLALVSANPLLPLRVELTRDQSQRAPHVSSPPAEGSRRDPWNRASLLDSLPGFETPQLRPEQPQRQLTSEGLLRGRVTVQSKPLVGALVRLYPRLERDEFFGSRDDALRTTRTDRDGQFQLRQLPLGALTLSIEHESRALPSLRPVRVTANGAPLELELESLGLRGRVIDPDGKPVPGAEIHLPNHWKRESRFGVSDGDGDQSVLSWRELQSPPAVAVAGSDGRFELHGLEPGSLTLGAREDRIGIGTLRISNFEQEVTIMLSSTSSLTVFGFEPKPMERALGLAWRWGRDYGHPIRFAYEQAHGTRFLGLSADEWTIFQAELDGWGEIPALRVLAPALLDPVGASTVRLHR